MLALSAGKGGLKDEFLGCFIVYFQQSPFSERPVHLSPWGTVMLALDNEYCCSVKKQDIPVGGFLFLSPENQQQIKNAQLNPLNLAVSRPLSSVV